MCGLISGLTTLLITGAVSTFPVPGQTMHDHLVGLYTGAVHKEVAHAEAGIARPSAPWWTSPVPKTGKQASEQIIPMCSGCCCVMVGAVFQSEQGVKYLSVALVKHQPLYKAGYSSKPSLCFLIVKIHRKFAHFWPKSSANVKSNFNKHSQLKGLIHEEDIQECVGA